jgi:ADP-ribosylglycohydrolase
MLCRTIFPSYLILLAITPAMADRRISVAEYDDKVYASWLGQCIGNMYGIPHEFKYNEEPRTEPIEGWAKPALDRIRKADGAFSDDDTDIEYVDLHLMEKYGPEPTYEQIAEFWKRHINEYIWVANRAARDLMERGYLPPLTGRKGVNEHWYQIDPQLVCEIWAITAPGMLQYAAAKADWAAKVTNDDYGTHPTIWYNVMYAAAFFEHDVEKLCELGYQALPTGSLFRTAIDDVRTWKKEHGQDWVAVRRKIKEKYHDKQGMPDDFKTGGVSATLNGTLGVAALLYGQGDFEKTLNLSCQMGYDADNQCATLAGLIAMTKGSKNLPRKYTHILEGWDKPLNDFYKNFTRDDLPDAPLTGIAARTARIGKDLVVMKGGKIEGDTLIINADAVFTPPLEVRLFPIHVSADRETNIAIEVIGADAAKAQVSIEEDLPAGLELRRREDKPVLAGQLQKAGRHDITVTVSEGSRRRTTTLPIFVKGPNLARAADKIIAAIERPTGEGSRELQVLRDGKTDAHYDSFDGQNRLDWDYYGYQWKQPVKLGRVVLHTGPGQENGGWFETLTVQYRPEHGAPNAWRNVEGLTIQPPYDGKNHQKGGLTFQLRFNPVTTTTIRIAGKPGGRDQFTSIAELEVRED